MQRVFDERKEGGKIIEKIVESFEFIKILYIYSKRGKKKIQANVEISNFDKIRIIFRIRWNNTEEIVSFFFSSPAWTSNIQRERRDSRKKKGKRKSIKYAGTRVYLCNKILEKFEYLVLHSSLTPSPPSSPTPSRLKIFADPPGENYARCMGNRWER